MIETQDEVGVHFDEATEDQRDELREQLAELVRSGGYPYIKITLVEPETGAVEITTHGLAEGVNLAAVFRQLADLIEGGE